MLVSEIPLLNWQSNYCKARIKTNWTKSIDANWRLLLGLHVSFKFNYKNSLHLRKADNLSDKPEITTSCPECATETREFELRCNGCKNNIPYCIATVISFFIDLIIIKENV